MKDTTGTLLRWTGEGSLADLERTAANVLRDAGAAGALRQSGDSLILSGPSPLSAASALQHLPGVSWIAAGYVADTIRGLAEAAATLAGRYLRGGGEFYVEAETGKGGHPSDVSGALTSSILDAVAGARVSQSRAGVVFRAALDGAGGAVGVQVRQGPGGAPTGRAGATCLVSGGAHSSVVAWMTMLAGARVTLVHGSSGEEGIRGAARLYAELSHRGDPRGLRLVVLEGGAPAPLLYRYVAGVTGAVFGGFTALRGPPPPGFEGRVAAPLYVATERYFAEQFSALGTVGVYSAEDWKRHGGGPPRVREFGGKRADISEVIDGLARRPRRRT